LLLQIVDDFSKPLKVPVVVQNADSMTSCDHRNQGIDRADRPVVFSLPMRKLGKRLSRHKPIVICDLKPAETREAPMKRVYLGGASRTATKFKNDRFARSNLTVLDCGIPGRFIGFGECAGVRPSRCIG